MDEIEIFSQLGRVDHAQVFTELFDGDAELARRVSEHLSWLRMIRHEPEFFPSDDWQVLPDTTDEVRALPDD